MVTNAATATDFCITFDGPAGQLRGCWAGPTTDAALHRHYYEVLAAAEAHGHCRFWLLDLRGRAWHSAEFGRWFTNVFAPQAHATLGRPVFMACVLGPAHYAAVEAPNAQAVQVGCVEHGLYIYYFDNEGDAQGWLEYQQALDVAPG